MKVNLEMDTALGVRGFYSLELATNIQSFLPGIRAESLIKYDGGVHGPEITSGPFEEGQKYYVYSNRTDVTDKLLNRMIERQAKASNWKPRELFGSVATA